MEKEFSSYSARVFHQVFAQRLSESFVLFTPFLRVLSKVFCFLFLFLILVETKEKLFPLFLCKLLRIILLLPIFIFIPLKLWYYLFLV